MSGDNEEVLLELGNEEIEELRRFYKNLNQPELCYVHLYLKNQLRWNKLMLEMDEKEVGEISDRCKMRLYRCRDGKAENRTIIGITGDNELTVFTMTLEESLDELRKCLLETSLIKWDLLPLFCAVNRKFHKLIYEIVEVKNLRVRIDNYCSTIWMGKEKAISYDVSVPLEVELKRLNISDYKLMNDMWPYKYPGSEKFIKSLIKLNGGLGVYQDGKLVSWILQVESFGIGLLQTLEEHQGKGYARLLTRAMTRKISEDHDEDVILFASYGKPKTVDLYIRYGYKHVSYAHWMYLKNIEN